MNKTKQLTLFPNQTKKLFGGALLHKKRKSKRPLSKKDPIHLVLRSEWAMGADSFLAKRNHLAIKRIFARFSKKFGVRIYQQTFTEFVSAREKPEPGDGLRGLPEAFGFVSYKPRKKPLRRLD